MDRTRVHVNIRICNHCKLVQVSWTPSDIIEICADCLPALRYLHPHAIIRNESLLDIPFEQLHETDGYIAGPPCPPTSSLGRGLAEADPRAHVFDYCINTLAHLGGRHNGSMLKFYILEHVPGSLKRKSRLEEEPYAARKQDELRAALPHFTHHLWVINSIDHGLPQDRRRIFFVGVHSACMQALGKSELDNPVIAVRPHQRSLTDFLDQHEVMPDIEERTPKQQHNIRAYNELMSAKIAAEPWVTVGCCDHSRNPSLKFGSFLHFDSVGTVTTNDPGKWVVGQVPDKVWGLGRPLTMSERARAQGIMPCSLECISEHLNTKLCKLNRLIGNSIPVNSIGVVIAAVCPALVAFERLDVADDVD